MSQLLKYVGENPSDGEVQDLMSEVDPSSSGLFKFPDFLSMMLRKMDENSAEDEIREAFKVFDSVSFQGLNIFLIIMTILFSRMVMVSSIDKNLVL